MSFLDAREHGSKVGSGGHASAQNEAIDRRERLRRLALETIDLSKDPYFMRNHLGQYECRLCLTLHNNEGNYLAHTQGKRHQQNMAKRAAREAVDKPAQPQPQRRAAVKKTVKIGRPGYRVTKQYDPEADQRSLLFQVEYPEIDDGEKPRHRFMSAYEQKKEAWDKTYQYLLFAAEPYEVVAFKVPNMEVDRTDRFFSHWDADSKVYSLQLPFKAHQQRITPPSGGGTGDSMMPQARDGPPAPPPGMAGPPPIAPNGFAPPPPPMQAPSASGPPGAPPPWA
ncbi:g1987 [Coccomyxa elongata]